MDISYSQNQALNVYEKKLQRLSQNSTVVGKNVGECRFILFYVLVFQMGPCSLLLVYIFAYHTHVPWSSEAQGCRAWLQVSAEPGARSQACSAHASPSFPSVVPEDEVEKQILL